MNKKNIKQLIRKNGVKIKGLGVTKIGLFGSYVRGEQKKASDIDILRACLEATLWAKKRPFFDDAALLFSSVSPDMHFKKRLVSSKN